MNKELILKYKKEFDYSLIKGNTLCMQNKKGEWNTYPDSNRIVDINWSANIEDIKSIVINDEYIDFRKALTEGKTIQFCYRIDKNLFWKDICDESISNYHLERLRIKPDEHKFKVGNWVRNGENIYQFIKPISESSYRKSLETCKPWQPQKGEWCWFWDNNHTNPVIRKFKKKIVDSEYPYRTFNDSIYENCEPFIGELPTHLKDK